MQKNIRYAMKNVLLAVFLAAGSLVPADNVHAVRYPSYSGYVNDYAGVISDEAKREIENLLASVERKTTSQIAVATVRTTAPETIEQYAVGLFADWGIGVKGKDNGILFLVAVEDRKVRIEVGYGLEGTVTDVYSKVIIDSLVVPAFRQGNYDLGVASGVVELVKLVSEHYGVEIDLSEEAPALADAGQKEKASPVATLFFMIIFFVFIFGRWWPLFFLGASGRGSRWSSGGGGSFGGGFGGFGGGMSGGGGASGGW
ncbi:MAG: TPM domain-containing protein [Candidatus Omnitrophica bacterium]|nr:TPM domain-containing protein [Candidatus Omnitrophota bacterium]